MWLQPKYRVYGHDVIEAEDLQELWFLACTRDPLYSQYMLLVGDLHLQSLDIQKVRDNSRLTDQYTVSSVSVPGQVHLPSSSQCPFLPGTQVAMRIIPVTLTKGSASSVSVMTLT